MNKPFLSLTFIYSIPINSKKECNSKQNDFLILKCRRLLSRVHDEDGVVVQTARGRAGGICLSIYLSIYLFIYLFIIIIAIVVDVVVDVVK